MAPIKKNVKNIKEKMAKVHFSPYDFGFTVILVPQVSKLAINPLKFRFFFIFSKKKKKILVLKQNGVVQG